MNLPKLSHIFFGLAVLLLSSACEPDCQVGDAVTRLGICPSADISDQIESIRVEAKQNITEFEYTLAYENYVDLDESKDAFLARELAKLDDGATVSPEIAQRVDALSCEASYGRLLSSFQNMFGILNSLVGGVLATSVAGAPAFDPLQEDSGILGESNDLGDNLNNFVILLTDPLRSIAEEAALLDEMNQNGQTCEFLLGPDSIQDITDTVLLREEQGYPNFFPLRLLDNKSYDCTDSDLFVEVRLGDKWGLPEAKILGAVSNLVVAASYFAIAHNIDFKLDAYQLALILGIDIDRSLESCLPLPSNPDLPLDTSVLGIPISDFHDCNGDNVISDVYECQSHFGSAELYWPQILRRIGFLFGDHPDFFSLDETRAAIYVPQIDNHLADAFSQLDTLFDDLIARSNRIEDNDELERYMIDYEDVSEDQKVGAGDRLGVNIADVRLVLPQNLVDGIGFESVEALQETIPSLLDILSITISRDAIIDDFRSVANKFRDQMLSVDNPEQETQLIKITDFQGIVESIPLVNFSPSPPIPDVFAFDFGAFFKHEDLEYGMPALRDLMPYWEAIPDPVVNYRNEWIVETEGFDETYRKFDRFYTDTDGREVGVLPWELGDDESHFTSSRALSPPLANLDCPSNFVVFDPEPLIGEDGLGGLACGAPLLTNQLPKDCFGPESAGEPPFEFLTYVYFQDPTFGGVFHSKTSTLQRANNSIYDDSSCFSSGLNSADYVPSNLWALHRGSFALYEWFAESNDLIFNLLYPILFAPPEKTSGGYNGTPNHCEFPDGDNDGVPDIFDNCEFVANNQLDTDGDSDGDACDKDRDGDGVFDNVDNCVLTANADQTDSNNNGKGDACEFVGAPAVSSDYDGDGVVDSEDNCVTVENGDQADEDFDGIGDVCDDNDFDGIWNSNDNCPDVANPDQRNSDDDAQGDACDDDDDNDEVLDAEDSCPLNYNPRVTVENPDTGETRTGQIDRDGDGIGDVCDPEFTPKQFCAK
jgi:hypothetical protein